MQPTIAPASPASISLYDARPFFEKALQFGLQNGIIDRQKLEAICTDAPKGMVQIARYFNDSTEFLRPDLEKAKDRMVNLVSLYLEDISGGDLRKAAESLRDRSFLSHSKGGSDLLKAMLALPESTSFHTRLDSDAVDERGVVKGLDEWPLKSFADYQAEFARRSLLKPERDAALWLAKNLKLDIAKLMTPPEFQTVIRTAHLMLSTNHEKWPEWDSFKKALEVLRKKYRAAKTRASAKAKKIGKATASAKPLTVAFKIPETLPQELRSVVQAVEPSIRAHLSQIVESPLPISALFRTSRKHQYPLLAAHYVWVPDIDIDSDERFSSKAWDKVMGVNCDDGSLLTLFVCVAAGAAPKSLLTEKAAKMLVRKIQKPGAKPGFNPELTRQYILDHAPAQHQHDYLQLWTDFVDEAQSTLQSDSTYAQQDALALLRRECHVKA